jgi:hypothetical protein
MWKNGLTWTGSILVAAAGGISLGYAAGASSTTGTIATTDKVIFGVSVGSLATLGSVLVAVGGLVQTGFTDRGCWVK